MAMTGEQIYGRRGLPPMPQSGGWRDFVRRRLAEIAGGTLILLGLVFLLSVATAHETDPSFNRAVDAPTMNLIGPVGAFVGDFALQGLGLAALIFAAAPIIWGWKLVRDRRLDRWWLKLKARDTSRSRADRTPNRNHSTVTCSKFSPARASTPPVENTITSSTET